MKYLISILLRILFSIKKRLKMLNSSYPKELPLNSYIHHSVSFVGMENLKLGKCIYIGSNSFINCNGMVAIEDGAMISSNVNILSEDHDFREGNQVPFKQQMIFSRIHIGRAAWVGLGAIILPGVKIGDGAIVGAGSVVTKDVESGMIVGGNPARKIGQREGDTWRRAIELENYYMLECPLR